MTLHDLLAVREPQPRAGQFEAVQPLEQPENPLMVLRRDSNAIVRHTEQPLPIRAIPRNANPQMTIPPVT